MWGGRYTLSVHGKTPSLCYVHLHCFVHWNHPSRELHSKQSRWVATTVFHSILVIPNVIALQARVVLQERLLTICQKSQSIYCSTYFLSLLMVSYRSSLYWLHAIVALVYLLIIFVAMWRFSRRLSRFRVSGHVRHRTEHSLAFICTHLFHFIK